MLQLVLDGSVMVGEGSRLNVLDVETIRRRVLLRANRHRVHPGARSEGAL